MRGKLYPMANQKSYVPKMGDPVLVRGMRNKYVVLVARSGTRTADVRTATVPAILYYNLPWSKLSYLDESLCAQELSLEARKQSWKTRFPAVSC
jgi:hypothetical protein